MWIVIVSLLCVLAVAVFFILRRLGGGRFPWFQFFAKGKESGFTFREINMLRRVAVENRLEDPTSLFWSVKQLDRSLRGLVLKYRSQGKTGDEAAVRFLSKLFEFRKRVEFDQPRYRLGLKSSRNMTAHQKIRISLPGAGPFFSQIVENLRRYLAIAYPQGAKLPPGFSWKGQKLSIYFWRAEDAGYVFETKVLDDFYDRQYPILHLAHSDNLVRSQKRRSIRIDTNKPAMLFPLKMMTDANEKVETGNGLRCRLVDLSEDGSAVLIGGRAKVGLSVKVQFSLPDGQAVMCGVVKGVSFDKAKNCSILHVQASTISDAMRNRILTYVYNLFGDRDDEIKKTPPTPPATAMGSVPGAGAVAAASSANSGQIAPDGSSSV